MCRASPCGKGNVCEADGKGAFICCCAPGLEGPTCEGKSGELSLNLVQVLFSVNGFTINYYNDVCQLVNAHFLIKSTTNGPAGRGKCQVSQQLANTAFFLVMTSSVIIIVI